MSRHADDSLLDRLTEKVGLLPHGTRGLTSSAYQRISAGALALAGLWVLDLFAWSGLWNMLFSGNLTAITPVGTPVAILFGFILATVILHFESSFLAMDVKSPNLRRYAIARMVLIAAFAFITSLPIDLYVLREHIDRRVHEEEVLRTLPELLRKIDQAAAMPKSQAAQAIIEQNTVKPGMAKDQAASAVSQAEQELAAAQLARRDADRVWGQRIFDARQAKDAVTAYPDDLALRGKLAAANGREKSAAAGASAARKAENARAGAVAESQKTLDARDLDLRQEAANTRTQIAKVSEADVNRIEKWVHYIWQQPPARRVHEAGQSGDALLYEGDVLEGAHGASERLIVLNDVLQGRPARRPSMTEADRQRLKELRLGAFVDLNDKKAEERQSSDASSLRWLALVVWLAFAALPCMVLVLKFYLFDESTNEYYERQRPRARAAGAGEGGGGWQTS